MTTITGKLVDNSGAPVSRKRIATTLKAATVVTEGGEQIVRDTATLSGTDGTWSLELTPTDNLIFPDGAYYKVWSGEQIWYITVPANGTHSLETVLVTPVSPDTQFAVTAEEFEAHITEFEALEATVAGLASGGSFGWLIADADTYGDGVTDATTHIQGLIDQAESDGAGIVYLPPGDYLISSTLTILGDNITLRGAGGGVTRLIAATTMTGNVQLLLIGAGNTGSEFPLTANASAGNSSISVSSIDANNFSADEYVLIKSDESIDSENTGRFAGEIQKIESINSGTLNLYGVLFDDYATSDNAAVAPLPVFHRNIVLRDFTTLSLAASSTLSSGHIAVRFVDGFQMRNVEVGPAWTAGIQLLSCLNCDISQCNIHDIKGSGTVHYGVSITSACAHITIGNNRFSRTRHSIATGGSGGTNREGIPRAITVVGNVSMETHSAHFDTHEPVDGIVFANNTCFGSAEGATNVAGIQVRGRNVLVTGNVIKNFNGRGIMLFGEQDGHVGIIGNYISDIGNDGVGIYVDSSGPDGHLIVGNTIRNCFDSAIQFNGQVDDVVVQGNTIVNCPTGTSNAAIFSNSGLRWVVSGNRIESANAPIETDNTADEWLITGNSFQGSGDHTPILVGSNNVVYNNLGYVVSNPNRVMAETFPVDMGLLLWNYDPATAAGQAALTSGTVHVARLYPRETMTISNLHFIVSTAGASLTAGQNYAGLYVNGSLIDSVDMDTGFTSTGFKSVGIDATEVGPDDSVYVALLSNGATPPQLQRNAGASPAMNLGLADPNLRFARADTSQTALPATMGTQTTSPTPVAFWCGVS